MALQFQFVSVYGFSSFLDDISAEPAKVGVPDGGSAVSLFGFAFLGLAAVRCKLRY
jgi:protein with PEP-CTERM/exosortase system signal